jgi:hypothetical protein
MNRFARLADNAHLSEKQREQLLKEAQTGKVSDKTRAELEKTITEQQKQGRAQGLTADALIAGANGRAGDNCRATTSLDHAGQTTGTGTGSTGEANLGMELKKKTKEGNIG